MCASKITKKAKIIKKKNYYHHHNNAQVLVQEKFDIKKSGYIGITEHNEDEKESWTRFYPATIHNIKFIKLLKELLITQMCNIDKDDSKEYKQKLADGMEVIQDDFIIGTLYSYDSAHVLIKECIDNNGYADMHKVKKIYYSQKDIDLINIYLNKNEDHKYFGKAEDKFEDVFGSMYKNKNILPER